MANNDKDTKNNRYIYRKVNFVRNVQKWKLKNIDWCKVGLKLEDIVTNNVGDND